MLEKSFQEFMQDRYGSDDFNTFLLILYFCFNLSYWVTHIYFYHGFSLMAIGLFCFRTLSKNKKKRQMENHVYMRYSAPILGWCRLKLAFYLDKDHRYFKCPNCKTQMRVPKGKGEIKVTCTNCGEVFQERS